MKNTRIKFRGNAVLRLWILALASVPFSTASAHDTSAKFIMNSISDAAYGRMIEAGRFDKAIKKIINSKIRKTDAIYVSTNLCVAYVVTRDLDNAAVACDTAIADFEERLASMRESDRRHSMAGRAFKRYLAMAYSNRGVLRAIGGADELARADFEKALALQVRLPAPRNNLARLDTRGAAAV